MSKYKIDKETAEQEFERFCETQRIDIDFEDFDDDDLKSFNQQKNRIIKALRRGQMVVDENGVAALTVESESGESIYSFAKPRGRMLLAMDRAKKGQDMKAMFDMMGDLCKVNPVMFSKMDAEDAKICMAVASLFLGS
jgi:hypothetical protein